MNWNLFHCLIRVKQLITTLTFLQERKLTPALSQHFEMAGGQASAFFSTHRKSRHNGPLSFPEWVNLSEARLVHTHLTCPWVFPGSWVPVSWLPLTFSLTRKPSNSPYFAHFFLSCGNHTMAVISQHIWLAGLIIIIASYSACK